MVIFYKLHSIDLQTVVSNKCNFIMVFTNFCKLLLHIKCNFIMVFTNFCKLLLHNSLITLQKNK